MSARGGAGTRPGGQSCWRYDEHAHAGSREAQSRNARDLHGFKLYVGRRGRSGWLGGGQSVVETRGGL